MVDISDEATADTSAAADNNNNSTTDATTAPVASAAADTNNNYATDATIAPVASTADAFAAADTYNFSTDYFRVNQHTSGPSNDPEEAMLKIKETTKKKSKK